MRGLYIIIFILSLFLFKINKRSDDLLFILYMNFSCGLFQIRIIVLAIAELSRLMLGLL